MKTQREILVSLNHKIRDLNGSLEFLIDSGSKPNIIKKRLLKSNVPVNRNEILKLTGITHHPP